MLQLWAETGAICLKFLDESGFARTSPLTYGYRRRGAQKRISQSAQRGRRISSLGFWQPQQSFEYGLVVGGFNSERYIKLVDWQAQKAQKRLAATGQITVLVQDRASFHTSQLVRQHWERWQQQGLVIFFLPPRSPQMNRIEDEWLHLKRDELASRVFDDDYEVALTVMAGIEARGQRRGYTVERFRFN